MSKKLDSKDKLRGLKGRIAGKKQLVALLLVVVAVLVAVAGAFIFVSVFSEEKELTYAEDLEQYKLQEGATQDDHNTNNLRLAWAYYEEENYERALELLGLVKDPAEADVGSYNDLYGLVLIALDRPEEAQQYTQSTLEEHEESLLASAEEYPIANYDLGKLYANTGNIEKAIEYYQKFVDAYTDTTEGTEVYDDIDPALIELAKQAIEDLR